MNFDSYGQYNIFRPSIHVEREIRGFVENELFKEYQSGIYTEHTKINLIIKKMIKMYAQIMEDSLAKVASRQFMEFVLQQYDVTCKINRAKLNDREREKWSALGPVLRRGLKYVAEKTTMIDPGEKPKNENGIEENISRIFISAEEMAKLYMTSDSTYRVFKDETQLTLKKGEDVYWDLKVNNKFAEEFHRRGRLHYGEILEEKQIDFNDQLINSELKEGFLEKFGMQLQELLCMLDQLSNGCEDEVPFVRKDELVNSMNKYFNIEPKIANLILDGFSLTKEKLIETDRQIFSPKQEYRALTRAFFEMSHQTGKHLIWSKEMVRENLFLLLRGLCYKKIPTEWLSNKIEKNLATLNNKVGTWFEKTVEKQLSDKLDMKGYSSIKKRIGEEDKFIIIPETVGEIDYIGINLVRNELILTECKMISPAVEPRFYYDDISKFMDEKKGYVNQFENKIDWVRNNKDTILECMLYALNIEITEEQKKAIKVKNVLLTFYPSIVGAFVKEFEICTLYEFLEKGKDF